MLLTVLTSSFRSRHQYDSVSLQAFVFAPGQLCLVVAMLVNKYAAQAVPCRAALPVSQFDQPALPSENFGGKLPAVLAGHGALDPFDDGRDGGAIVLELLGYIADEDVFPFADVLVVRRFISILETTPAADVVHQDEVEVGLAGLNIGN